MRLIRVRITVRKLMIVVLIVALSIGLGKLYIRRQTYLKIAAEHKAAAEAIDNLGTSHFYKYIIYIDAVREWHKEMQGKYEEAARYPWLAVEPDPPPPQKPGHTLYNPI
jgi:hypothetical protein